MKALIIDDEKTGAMGLKFLLEEHCKHLTVIAIDHSAPDGIKRILEVKPDLVFLDIEMSPDTGFDVIEATRHIPYYVIFTTAYDSYAIKAFKAQAVDYLLKPIDVNELKQAVHNVMLRDQKSGSVTAEVPKVSKKIPLPTNAGVTVVSADDIIYLESDSNYTTVFLNSGSKIMISKTLKSFEEKLNMDDFCRVHAAYIVNLNAIDRYIRGDGGNLVLKNKTSIPVSRAHKQSLLQKIGF